VNHSKLAIEFPGTQQQQSALKASEKGKTVKKATKILLHLMAVTLLILLLSAVCSASAVWT
jgi:hypothetical protein